MKKQILLSVILIITFGVNSKCIILYSNKNEIQKVSKKENSLLSKILKQLKLTNKDIQEELYVEKIMPNDKSLSIIVIPKIVSKEDNDESLDLDSYILVVENKTGNIKSKFYESNSWTSDAIALTSIEIDTAPYLLNKTNRGFGIRVNYTGRSNPNPYSQTDLSLFIEEGKILKRVLKDFPISEFHGEWDMNCNGEFETVESTIIIDKVITNNFYNLKIKQKITDEKNHKVKDDCIEKKVYKSKMVTLKYNKKEYK
jgi:hypothetical protein